MKLTKKQWISGGAALLSLVVCGVLTIVSSSISSMHEARFAAQRWQSTGDVEYTQVSAFLTEDAMMTEESLQYIRESVDASMRSASLAAPSDSARVWYDAYSAQAGIVTATGTKRYSAQAQVTAVGGDFFLLHLPDLLDGSYLQESDLMQDRLILDETLAWQLFGSSNVEGMHVQIGTRTYPVAGVIAREEDYATEKAYGDLPRMYISFGLYEDWTAENGGTALIECYEMVLPNPVRNFAKNAFDNALGASNNSTMETIEQTNRCTLSEIWANLRDVHGMLIVNKNLAYPYWENAARIVDFDLTLLLAARILFLVYPVMMGLWLLWKGWRRLDAFITAKREAHKNRLRLMIHDEEDNEGTTLS